MRSGAGISGVGAASWRSSRIQSLRVFMVPPWQ
jgi:hypothetical protein